MATTTRSAFHPLRHRKGMIMATKPSPVGLTPYLTKEQKRLRTAGTWKKTSFYAWQRGDADEFRIERRASGRHGWYGNSPWNYSVLQWNENRLEYVPVKGPFPTLKSAKAAIAKAEGK